jgi:hypothetical protein
MSIDKIRIEQAADARVFVRVQDRPILHELARKKIEIDQTLAEHAARNVQSRILAAATHLAWRP